MKTLSYVLLTTGLLLTTYSTASAQQCHTHPGFLPKAAPAAVRYHHFRLDGMTNAFALDLQTGDIFCDGQRIGLRTADGQVQLDNAAVARLGAPAAGQVAPVGQPGVAGQPGPAGQPIPAPQGGQPGPAGQPAVNGSAPVGASAPAAPAANGAAPVRSQAQAAPAVNGIPAPVGQNAPPAIPALGSSEPINPAFTGQWRSESKNILGRSTLSELTIEGSNLVLRVQTGGEESNVFEGTMEFKDGKLLVKNSSEERNLGAVSVANGQLVLAGDETLSFKRIEE